MAPHTADWNLRLCDLIINNADFVRQHYIPAQLLIIFFYDLRKTQSREMKTWKPNIQYLLLISNNNNHWHNSPLWAKAFLRSFRHPSLFLAVLLQCLSPNFLTSPVTPSSHLSLGLLFCHLPSTTAAKSLLARFCSSSRITCPAHLRPLILIYVMMLLSLYSVYKSSLYFILPILGG